MANHAPHRHRRPRLLIGFTLYVGAAVTLADHLGGIWWLQALYFLAAGLLWTVPTRWLMLWAARR